MPSPPPGPPFSLDGDTTALPATTRSGIPYEIETHSYREQWAPGGSQVSVVCRVREPDANTWVTDMVGRVYVQTTSAWGGTFTGTPRGKVRRDLPEPCPLYPALYCTLAEQADQGGVPTAGVTAGTQADPASGWPITQWMRYRCTFQG